MLKVRLEFVTLTAPAVIQLVILFFQLLQVLILVCCHGSSPFLFEVLKDTVAIPHALHRIHRFRFRDRLPFTGPVHSGIDDPAEFGRVFSRQFRSSSL
jgi:hypothetical protein